MYYKQEDSRGNPKVWLDIDPLKVKQRIDRIANQLEGVRRKFEPLLDIANLQGQEKR